MLQVNNFLIYLSFLCGLSVLCGKTMAEPPPSPQKINETIDAENIDRQKFEQDSFPARMQFELTGRLLSDKTSFCEFVSIARSQFERDFNQQQSMLEQIQNYEGTDWEELYGSSGLWRRLASSTEKSRIDKASVDYYYATICRDSNENSLEEILSDLGWPKQNSSADIITVKILCDLSKTDKKYEAPARQLFSKLKLRSDINQCDAVRVSIEQIQCFGVAEPNEINSIARALEQSECQNDRDLLFTFANLRRKFAPGGLQSFLSGRPQTAILLDKILLDELFDRFSRMPARDVNLLSINPLDAELAAIAALSSPDELQKARGIGNLIIKLADDDGFQSPAVIYLAAAIYGQENPKKTIELLIRASNLQAKNKNVLMPVSAEDLAKRAFDIAYQEFLKDPNNCTQAIGAYENYSRIAPAEMDEQAQYLYANLLNNCNRSDEAIKYFQKLSKQTQNLWRDAANLELLKIELDKAKTAAEANEGLTRLGDFILGSAAPEERENQLRLEALNLYCNMLLRSDINNAPQKVLKILSDAPPTPGIPYEFYRAQALYELDRLAESIAFMANAVDNNDCSIADSAESLLSEVLDKIETWQQKNSFNIMLEYCEKIAGFDYNCRSDAQNALTLAEVLILQNKPEQAAPLLPENNDLITLRVRARLLMDQNDFSQAAILWSKIADEKRNEPAPQNEKSFGWWQAEYYELYCLSKMPSSKHEDILHTIEVLENTYSNIPAPWPEKFDSLKQKSETN